jgi:hypothetical protein
LIIFDEGKVESVENVEHVENVENVETLDNHLVVTCCHMLSRYSAGAWSYEVYNVLPAGVRCYWTVKAILAGKHVLSETPSVPGMQVEWMGRRIAETFLSWKDNEGHK